MDNYKYNYDENPESLKINLLKIFGQATSWMIYYNCLT